MPSTPPRHILVAEDNVMNQLLIKRLLKQLGHTCVVANNGVEAVRAAKDERFDIILMDVQMPEMDGIEAIRRIRANPEVGLSPLIIVLTANHLEKTRVACMDAGADEFLTKPISITDLQEAIAERPTRQSRVESGNLAGRLTELLSLGDAAFVHELVDLFLDDSQDRLKDLEVALMAEDWDTVQKISHLTKGSAANMGADSFRDICMVLNEASHKQDLSMGSVALRHAEEEYRIVRKQLTTWKINNPA